MASEGTAAPVAAAAPDGTPDADHAGARAVALIDAVAAGKPEKDDHKLAAAVENICAWRRDWLARRDAGAWGAGDEQRLGALNGVLSVVLAVQFPLGEVRWAELDGARAALAGLVGSDPA